MKHHHKETHATPLRTRLLGAMLLAAWIPGWAIAADPPNPPKGYVLFAHGMDDHAGTWERYAVHAQALGYQVHRTSVISCGLVETRGEQLADYINSLPVPPRSLKAVGHSMGGLDLRYIVGKAYDDSTPQLKFRRAANKIMKVYTIGTPHQGNVLAGFPAFGCAGEPARISLSNDSMDWFNVNYPYAKFSLGEDEPRMPFLAFYFQCTGGTDGTVGTVNQRWQGAPSFPMELSGTHSSGVSGIGCPEELNNTRVLDFILSDVALPEVPNEPTYVARLHPLGDLEPAGWEYVDPWTATRYRVKTRRFGSGELNYQGDMNFGPEFLPSDASWERCTLLAQGVNAYDCFLSICRPVPTKTDIYAGVGTMTPWTPAEGNGALWPNFDNPQGNVAVFDITGSDPIAVWGRFGAYSAGYKGMAGLSATCIAPLEVHPAPIAHAGSDRTVRIGSIVALNGSGSTDPEGGTLEFIWENYSTLPPAGNPTPPAPATLFLADPSAMNPRFTPAALGTFRFSLTVDNGVRYSEVTDTVDIKVAALGDIDADGDVDSTDLNFVVTVRNTPASSSSDPRDLDGNMKIDALDARKLTVLCTRPRCATQ